MSLVKLDTKNEASTNWKLNYQNFFLNKYINICVCLLL